MSNKCINYSSKEWKDLVNKYGKVVAERITYLNNMDVPSLARAEEIVAERKKTTSANQSKKTYSGKVTSLQPNQIFVFGSNPEGRHGAGAAKYAKDNFGAVYGQGEGLQGQSYALPTKDLRVKENKSLRSISSEDIIKSIKKLYEVAKQNLNKEFLVSDYSESNLNGYTGQEMADMFNAAGPIPSNIIFNENFDKLIQNSSRPVQKPTEVKISTSDRVIFGHPTIGKSFLKNRGENRFITLDDDYKDEINTFVDTNRGSETRQEYKGRKPKEYNEFMLNLYDRLKVQAQKQGKILFVSNTNILKERMSDFDKVITMPKEEFKRRFDERGATYGFEDWKSDIDATIAKVPNNRVITTTGYLSELLPQEPVKDKLSLVEKRKLLEGINHFFISRLFKNGDPEALYVDGVSSTTINSIFEETLEDDFFPALKAKYTTLTNPSEKAAFNRIGKLLSNEEVVKELMEDYRKFLRSFNIEIEAAKDEDTVNSKDSAFSKEAHKISLDDSINGPIKMLIASLSKPSLNEFGLPELVDYDKTKNLIANNLANTPAEYGQYIAKLKELAKSKPEINQLIERLGETISPSDSPAKFKLKTQLMQSFGKNKNTYFLGLIKKDGNILIFDSNANKLKDQLKLNWYNNLKESTVNGVFTKEDLARLDSKLKEAKSGFGDYSPKQARVKRANSLGEAYKILGIELSDKNLLDNYEKLVEILEAIKTYSNISSVQDVYEGDGVSGRLNELTDLEAKYSNVVELQSQNAEGETVYGISLNNYLSLIVNELNTYAGNEAMLRQKLPHLFHVNSKRSEILQRVIEGKKIQLDILDGLKVEGEEGTATKDLEVGDKWVMQLNGLLQGFYPYLRAADRGIENGFRVEGGLLAGSRNNAVALMIGYLKDELDTSLAYKQGLGQDIRYYNQKLKGSKYAEGERLKVFREIIKFISEDDLQKIISSPTFNVERWVEENKKSIEQDINNWFQGEITKVRTDMEEYGLLAKDKNNNIISLSKEFEGSIDEAIELATVNQIVGFVEQLKLLVGDPAFYKSNVDFFKRTTMFNGTKKISAVGHEVNEWLNANRPRLDNKPYDDTFTSVILEDNKVAAKQDFMDMLKVILTNGNMAVDSGSLSAYMKAYEEMDEADAQGLISLDGYRETLLRSGDWSKEMEVEYQKEVEFYKKVFIEKDTKFLESYKPTFGFLFQPLKTQHVGPMLDKLDAENQNNSLYVPTGYKHSLMPLIPSVVYNRNMGNLLQHMVENKIDIAQYASANKYGTKVGKDGKANLPYNAEGNAVYSDLITQKTSFKYIGIQLDIAPKVKKEITASTQDRKLTLSNIFKDGEIINPELKAIVEEYDYLQSYIVEQGLNEVIEELGLRPIVDGEGNVVEYETIDRTKFKDYIKRSAESRNNPENIIKAIERLQDPDVVVDNLLNRDKIINLINAIIENNSIKEKRFGGASPQASSTLMEPKGTNRINKISNYLRFYSVSKVTGNTLPMQIEKSIPKEWKNWVEKLGGLNKFNELVAETNRLYFEYHEGKLKEEPKYPIDIRILMAKGFRIPNQGPNSTDAVIISNFLPYNAGETLIVPSEMVAKAGSDFDIDKFNIYLPHVRLESDDSVDVTEAVNKRVRKDLKSKAQFTEDMLLEINDKLPTDRTAFEQDVFKIYSQELEKVNNVVYDNFSGMDKQPQKSQIQNRMLELQMDIVLHKDNARQLLAPITDYVVKDVMLNSVDPFRPAPEVETVTDIVSPFTNIRKFLYFLAGKAGVGQTAVHLTNHTLAQRVGMHVKDRTAVILFDHNKTKEGLPSLGGVKDVTNKYVISETLSAFLNAYVDIAKDPYIFRLNAGTKVANTIFYMLRLGADPVWVAKFINQPAIVDYVKQQSIDESETVANFTEPKKNKRIAKIMRKYGYSGGAVLYDTALALHEERKTHPGVRTEKIEDLENKLKDIASKYGSTTLTYDTLNKGLSGQGGNQAMILDQFLEYQRQATLFQKMVRATSPDTKGLGKNTASVKTLLETQEEVFADNFIGNVDKVLNNTFIKSFNKVLIETNKLYKNFLVSEIPQISTELRRIDKMYQAVTKSLDQKERISAAVIDDFIYYILSSTSKIKNGVPQLLGTNIKEVGDLFKGNNSLAKKIISIKKGTNKNSHLLKNNPIIQEFVGMLNTEGGFDNIKIFSRKINAYTQDVLTEAFREIFEIDANLGEQLVKFGIVQSGLNNSPITFVKLIPEEQYFNLFKEAIDYVKEDPSRVDMKSFEMAFMLQNLRYAPRYATVFNDDIGEYTNESISDRKAKSKFKYIKKINASTNKQTGKTEFKTNIYRRSELPNENGNYSYELIGESAVNYLTPKLYSPIFTETDYIKKPENLKC